MNYRMIVIIIAVVLMVLAPTTAGLIAGGQALDIDPEQDFDKSGLEKVTVELYINSTGEKVRIDLEEYVTGVLLAEVPAYCETDTLKAMAVAIRSYCLRRMENGEKELRHFSADVCDDYTHCMGYISLSDAAIKWGADRTDALYKIAAEAVQETKGEILCYEGMIADAVFHESSDGYTESAENVWGFDIPYLISVKTPEDVNEISYEYTSEELKSILENEGVIGNFEGSPDGWLGGIERDQNGRVGIFEIAGTRLAGRRVREIFGLSSTAFDITYAEGKFLFKVTGAGHGVGMSMAGADSYAANGMDYAEILAHYYPGTELVLYSS